MSVSVHRLSAFSFEDLRRLAGDMSRPSKLAHNTTIRHEGGDVIVRLHHTDILTVHPDDSFTLNTGGWETTTTKQRLNALLPRGYRIFSNSFKWYVSTPSGEIPFYDGMTLS